MRQIERAAPSIVLIGVLGMTVLTILEYQPFSYAWWALLGLMEAASTRSALATPAVSEDHNQNGVAGGNMRVGD
jgi:hypothetical protein